MPPGPPPAPRPPGGQPLPPAPGQPPGGQFTTARLRAELEEDIRRVEGENEELDLLMEQVLVEIERHQARRAKMETELATLEASAAPDYRAIGETRDHLMTLTRREFLFDSQRQVLQSKKRGLARYLQRLVEIDTSLGIMAAPPANPAAPPMGGQRPLLEPPGGRGAGGMSQPALQMRSQEDMRREIVRQLHDGPAQSIATIGLQAEIVERLVTTNDERALVELESLRRLVQQALDSTKAFIFEVRPMVLDDLGLGPTIRRAADDRGRRAEVSVEFDTQGIEQRIAPDLESAVFRSVDEAIAGFILRKPPTVLARLDWTERELVATVEGTWPRSKPDTDEQAGSAPVTRPGETPPVLLAMMEEKRSQDRDAVAASRSLGPERVAEIGNRARAFGMTLTMRSDGQVMELVVPISYENR